MRALVLCVALALGGCGTGQPPLVTQSPTPITAVGRIDAASEARQLAAGVDGLIERVAVQRGDRVVRGQPLLEVACAPRRSAIWARTEDAAQAAASAATIADGARREDIAAASAQLAAARSAALDRDDALARAERLEGDGFVTRREIVAKRNAAEGARADVSAAAARLSLLRHGARASERTAARARAASAAAEAAVARAQAEQCIVRSPIGGTVLQIMRREGEFSGASQGTPLIVVGNLDRLIVRAELNERDAAAVHIGQGAEIRIDGDQRRWKGHIIELAAVMGRRSARSLDPTDRFDRDTREAIIAFDGDAPRLVGLRVMVGLYS